MKVKIMCIIADLAWWIYELPFISDDGIWERITDELGWWIFDYYDARPETEEQP